MIYDAHFHRGGESLNALTNVPFIGSEYLLVNRYYICTQIMIQVEFCTGLILVAPSRDMNLQNVCILWNTPAPGTCSLTRPNGIALTGEEVKSEPYILSRGYEALFYVGFYSPMDRHVIDGKSVKNQGCMY